MKRYTEWHFPNILKSTASMYYTKVRHIHTPRFSDSAPVQTLIRNECLFLPKDIKKFMAALSVAPNWKDIQYPFTVEWINGGIIIQWNIDNWGGQIIHTWMTLRYIMLIKKLPHKSSYYLIPTIWNSKTGKTDTQ